ncbi:Chromatin-remodeling ATPase INO80 [Frankliniella fusca]|uniref:Chromatin-remodeling ATPase INO80 n=1 Tax=Frankliniella fusca TaxID=407009 RepID=A0AAE1H9X0_9NEOP|nr:Chromatin-remodeling ATPase INO80 [Frankliniella fusca]
MSACMSCSGAIETRVRPGAAPSTGTAAAQPRTDRQMQIYRHGRLGTDGCRKGPRGPGGSGRTNGSSATRAPRRGRRPRQTSLAPPPGPAPGPAVGPPASAAANGSAGPGPGGRGAAVGAGGQGGGRARGAGAGPGLFRQYRSVVRDGAVRETRASEFVFTVRRNK